MKVFADFLAVILFFVTYNLTKNMITATVVAIVIGIIQAAYTLIRYRKMSAMQWLSLVLIVGFGGATVWLKDERFIMLKPTILFWLIGTVVLVMQLFGKNGLKMILGSELTLPEIIWKRLAYAWIIFFAAMGALNLFVAYPFTPAQQDTWAAFKLYGYLPLTLAFSLLQGLYLIRYLPKENQ